MTREEGQKLVFALREVHGRAVLAHLKAVGVDGDAAAGAHGVILRGGGGEHRRAAEIRLDARKQLAHGKGLGDVVVRTDLKAEDLVLLLFARGQDDDGHVVALGAQRAADIEAHHFRHHHVEQDEVGLFFACHGETRLAVIGLERVIARTLQVEADDIDDVFLVLDDEDGLFLFHQFSLSCLSFCAVRRAWTFRMPQTVLASSSSPRSTRASISSNGVR